jgi:hypothetical protein
MMRPAGLVGVVFLVAAVARAQEGSEPLTWKLDGLKAPFRYDVSIDHREKGGSDEKLTLDLGLRMELKTSDPKAGHRVWRLVVERLRVRRTTAAGSFSFDSKKKKNRDAGSAEIRWLAELPGKDLEITVSKTGKITGLRGFLSRPPGGGSFLAEGRRPDEDFMKGLVAETISRLFHLPGQQAPEEGKSPRLFCFGAVLDLGGSTTAGFHLSRVEQAKKPAMTKSKGVECVKLSWSSELHSDGGKLSAAGVRWKMDKGKKGTAKGTGTFALDAGFIDSLSETVQYKLPTPFAKVQFKRTVKIAFAGWVEGGG